jgi:ubiquinone biosynthesis protein UbiJ
MRDEDLWQLGDELRALARLVRQLEKRLEELERRTPQAPPGDSGKGE